MESIDNFFDVLQSVLGKDILYYFTKFYEYLDDVFEDRKVDMDFDTKYDNLKTYKKNIENILNVASLGLRTIGVSKDQMQDEITNFLDSIKEKNDSLKTYGETFNTNIKPIIEFFLIDIIVKYLTNEDKETISNLDLFDLLPRGFVNRLDDFEITHITPKIKSQLSGKKLKIPPMTKITELVAKPEIEVEPNLKTVKIPEVKPIKVTKKEPPKPTPKVEIKELDILDQIKLQKEESVKIIEEKKVTAEDDTSILLDKISQRLTEDISFIEGLEKSTEISKPIEIKPPVEEKESFLEYFGAFPELPTSIKNGINIIKENFLKINTRELQDLETFYYYIACLKMMGEGIPYSSEEIAKKLQNFMYERVFSEAPDVLPDPLSVFFGTAIFSVFNLLSKKAVDINKIKSFLKDELEDFIPWKLHLNTYSLLTLRVLEKNGVTIDKYPNIGSTLSKFDLNSLEENYYPSIDLFDKLISLKIIDGKIDFNSYTPDFLIELEKNILNDGSINNNLTDTSKFLLIASMLDIDETINDKIEKMIHYIKNEGNFFYNPEKTTKLNWSLDDLGFKLEVRMLFWTLLALSQFPHL